MPPQQEARSKGGPLVCVTEPAARPSTARSRGHWCTALLWTEGINDPGHIGKGAVRGKARGTGARRHPPHTWQAAGWWAFFDFETAAHTTPPPDSRARRRRWRQRHHHLALGLLCNAQRANRAFCMLCLVGWPGYNRPLLLFIRTVYRPVLALRVVARNASVHQATDPSSFVLSSPQTRQDQQACSGWCSWPWGRPRWASRPPLSFRPPPRPARCARCVVALGNVHHRLIVEGRSAHHEMSNPDASI